MKPLPAPHVPRETDAERMSNALKAVLTVSKKDLLKAEAASSEARNGRSGLGNRNEATSPSFI
jgi:hypothetical protein